MASLPCPLLDKIPPELRNSISRLILKSEDPIGIESAEHCDCMVLLQACRQIRNEASGIFYSENGSRAGLEVDGGNALRVAAWVDALGDSSAHVLRGLVLALNYSTSTKRRMAERRDRHERFFERSQAGIRQAQVFFNLIACIKDSAIRSGGVTVVPGMAISGYWLSVMNEYVVFSAVLESAARTKKEMATVYMRKDSHY